MRARYLWRECNILALISRSGRPMTSPRLLSLLAAFGTGCLLTLMVLFNGQMAAAGTPLFASWLAHGAGSVAAIAFLAGLFLMGKRPKLVAKIPLWAYFGGASGALTVMLTSFTVNSSLALSGTIALGLAGQVVFGLLADLWGFLGLPKRHPSRRDMASIGLILAGCIVLIFLGKAP